MDIFESAFNYTVSRRFKQLELISVVFEHLQKQLEMSRQHIGNKDCILLAHFFGKRYVFTLFQQLHSFHQALR